MHVELTGTAEPRRRPGRPRDASIGERALAATRDLLVERGFEAATMQAVADRAGVHASALYRRWPSRFEMIAEATFPGLDPADVRPTGDLRRDLRRFIRAYLAAFSAPAARAAAAGLLARNQAAAGPRPADLTLRVSARPQFRDILRAAPQGSVDPAIEPDDAFDMLLGAILARILLPPATARRQPVERIVGLMVRLLRPAHELDLSLRRVTKTRGCRPAGRSQRGHGEPRAERQAGRVRHAALPGWPGHGWRTARAPTRR